jgi:hypothetical protein
MSPPGAPTISGKLSILEGDVLHVFFDIFIDGPEPLTGNGIVFETGKLEHPEFKDVPLELFGDISAGDLRKLAKLFTIVTHHQGLGPDKSASVISFYSQGGSILGKLLAAAVISPGFEVNTLEKGHVKWNLL